MPKKEVVMVVYEQTSKKRGWGRHGKGDDVCNDGRRRRQSVGGDGDLDEALELLCVDVDDALALLDTDGGDDG